MVKKKVDKPKSKEPKDHLDAKLKIGEIMEVLDYDVYYEVHLYDVRQRDHYYTTRDYKMKFDKTVYSIEARDALTGKNILEKYPILNERINDNYLKRNDIFCIHQQDQSLVIVEIQDITDSIHGKPRVMNRDLNSVLRIMMMYPEAIIIHVGKGWVKDMDSKMIKREMFLAIQNATNPMYKAAQEVLGGQAR